MQKNIIFVKISFKTTLLPKLFVPLSHDKLF